MPPKKNQKEGKVVCLSPIRVEKEFLRFPIHNLAKRGRVAINIKSRDKTGRDIEWKVFPNSRTGEAGELAYKIDTLIINRRIEAAGSKKPRILKLGSLRSVCRELGLTEGKASNDVKKALLQNAFTGIVAKFFYKSSDGSEQKFEHAFTRYSVVFTGEKLPNEKKADAVYIILDEGYQQYLSSAGTRPLDYNYLRDLPPTAQRFYELVAPQIFAAIKHRRAFAKYSYAEFCVYSALTRYTEYKQVKKQMYKILKPHKDSGYIKEASFHEIEDDGGEINWLIHIVPGEKAHTEFNYFNRNSGEAGLENDKEETFLLDLIAGAS